MGTWCTFFVDCWWGIIVWTKSINIENEMTFKHNRCLWSIAGHSTPVTRIFTTTRQLHWKQHILITNGTLTIGLSTQGLSFNAVVGILTPQMWKAPKFCKADLRHNVESVLPE
jgi:hypothetical protein